MEIFSFNKKKEKIISSIHFNDDYSFNYAEFKIINNSIFPINFILFKKELFNEKKESFFHKIKEKIGSAKGEELYINKVEDMNKLSQLISIMKILGFKKILIKKEKIENIIFNEKKEKEIVLFIKKKEIVFYFIKNKIILKENNIDINNLQITEIKKILENFNENEKEKITNITLISFKKDLNDKIKKIIFEIGYNIDIKNIWENISDFNFKIPYLFLDEHEILNNLSLVVNKNIKWERAEDKKIFGENIIFGPKRKINNIPKPRRKGKIRVFLN